MKKIIILVILQVLCSSFVWADLKGDINGDDKVGLEEAVYALQATSGLAVQPVEDTCITCDGTLSSGGRWCTPDPEDGTVKDMDTGLVWLKNAGCRGSMNWADAVMDPIENLCDGVCALSDGSVWGDWRLPTKEELLGLTVGTEPVSSETPQAFTGVQSSVYWSSMTVASYTYNAWLVYMDDGYALSYTKDISFYVWPVRSDN
jgi:hypothetical protein